MYYVPRSIRFLPLGAICLFILMSVAAFFFSPFDWRLNNEEYLVIFLLGVLLAINLGYILAATSLAKFTRFGQLDALYIAGGVSAAIMLFPSSYVYTGKMPWEVISVLFEQGQAYSDLQARLAEYDGQRGPIVAARIATQWLIYASVPLGIIRWSAYNWLMRIPLFLTIGSLVVFSILRGTDQGTFEATYLVGMSLLLVFCRHLVRIGRSISSFIINWRSAAAAVVLLLVSLAAFTMFLDRKIARYEGKIELVCLGENRQICMDPNHAVTGVLSLQGQFAAGMLTSYFSAGYYGLALSLPREFQSTWGVGHSSALTRFYESFTGDTDFYDRSFTARLRQDGWSDKYLWSTIYTWIANDVGFPATILVIGVFAYFWGSSWRDSIGAQNDCAAPVFCMLTQTFLYSPANAQLFIGIDTYVALVIWLIIWLLTSRGRAI